MDIGQMDIIKDVISVEDRPDGRFYQVSKGIWYPSITTVLGKTKDMTSLEDWKARVGKDEAFRVSKQATDRGNEIHGLFENYIKTGALPDYKSLMPPIRKAFKQGLNYFAQTGMEFVHSELAVWSDTHKIGGRTDGIFNRDNIIDFKGSSSVKKPSDIEDYFLQVEGYGICLQELYGVVPKNYKIMVFVEYGDLQIFDGVIGEKRSQFLNRVNAYHNKDIL